MTDSKTIHEQAQTALLSLNCSHPDGASAELSGVLERMSPDSPDATALKRAIAWLEEIAVEITRVEDLLVETNFTFGRIEKWRGTTSPQNGE